ncbi:DNA topoisomerase III [Salmonella enterica]|uniref:DNA topoisomerase n=1 Tax=Salmonella enterica TaxID=28901 RepID=A0A5T2WI44_SALER|nr:DNA topoisomerase III [Salmonella enterica]EBV5763638.1 DNA topoisomerase III [Salmonella enterica subsp. enterica serovar Hvittingfoss]ECE9635883.1 DNA topoisomerase III [Salmonella enterica subsp. enterica serovar Muenchen]ECY5335805.1 DNA topoisomerase III [Salmonella enterica subsp. enterica serovar Stanley]EDH9951283.1 DNA topoisomerase III [Salmonella enterica subsp. enterica serovar Newport]EDV0967467.1 DNA topoisomerase III [Salmonella enterica subsp. enterica serovar Singapore]
MRLFLCEKPSQARDIAKFIGAGQCGDGFLSGPGVIVTWARGHLLEQAEPEAYGEQYGNPWRLDVLPFVPQQWKLEVKKDGRAQFSVINRLLKQVDEVVIATDADREGEVIARELLEYCRFQGRVFRLWLSALDDASIRNALANIWPSEKTEALYCAGVGRGRADWITGMNLTRLYTLKAREAGISGVMSVGRVQTPTLAIVVRRDLEIENFIPKPYSDVIATLVSDNIAFPVKWVAAAQYCDEEVRCIQAGIAKQVVELCRQIASATVIDCQTKRQKKSAPLAFSLGSLQQACAEKFGMPAQKVLDIAQSLYETHKLTTYPRTDCGYLPVSMRDEVRAVLTALMQSDPSLKSHPALAQLDISLISRIWNDKKITAHHGIIPTKQAGNLSRLSTDERNVYQLIRQHYLAQFLPQMEVDATEATFNIGGQLFRTTSNVVVVAGWKALFTEPSQTAQIPADGNDDKETVSRLPPLQAGQTCRVQGAEEKRRQTKTPVPYNDGTLIAAMMNAASLVTDAALKKVLKENAGIGTEATRAGIIDTLVKRGFLVRGKKALHSTPTGRDLVSALPSALTSPGLTALWEQLLDEVAAGRVSLDDFMAKQKAWVVQLVSQGKLQPLAMQSPPGPPCPECGGRTVQRQGKNGVFFGCVNYSSCSGISGSGGLIVKIPKGLKVNLR